MSINNIQKGVGVILIIILLAAAALGGFLIYQSKFKPTPSPQPTTQPSPSHTDETADWKTYRNEEYGFELKYPSRYQREEREYEFLDKNELVLASFFNKDSNALGVYVIKTPLKDYLYYNHTAAAGFTFDETNKKWVSTPESGIDPTGELQKLSPQRARSKVAAYVARGGGELNCSTDVIIIPHPSRSYIIQIGNTKCFKTDDIIGNYDPEPYNLSSDQILSTFKFIN